MLTNFTFYNPTKLYFGKDAINGLDKELAKYGKNVLLVYGYGSIKKNGVYDAVVAKLKANGKNVFDDAGVMPNPTIEKMYGGISLVKKHKIDLILAVGGGSVVDYAKAMASLAYEDGDLWQRFFVEGQPVKAKNIPLAVVLTMVGTGSEMNGGSVISNIPLKQKMAYMFDTDRFPKFSILNPEYTFSVPRYQMVAGIFDIFSHILEQYISFGGELCASDYIAEGLMRSLIDASLVAVDNPVNYEARANIMWTSTWALNTLLSKAKNGDWNVHQIAHGVASQTDATHGMALASVSLAYYNFILDAGVSQFKKLAVNVFKVDVKNKTDKEIAAEGLKELEKFMCKIGLVKSLAELGFKNEMMIDALNATHLNSGGFKKVSLDDVKGILLKSM